MSCMSELYTEIEDLVVTGLTRVEIANKLNIPVSMVDDFLYVDEAMLLASGAYECGRNE